MDYVLVVKQPVYGSQGAFLAYQLAQELVQKHRICQIFFYPEGISNGNALAYPANDEFNLVNAGLGEFSQALLRADRVITL